MKKNIGCARRKNQINLSQQCHELLPLIQISFFLEETPFLFFSFFGKGTSYSDAWYLSTVPSVELDANYKRRSRGQPSWA